jgi:hypothetical protein
MSFSYLGMIHTNNVKIYGEKGGRSVRRQCSESSGSKHEGILANRPSTTLYYFMPRFFFSMTTCVSSGSAQTGQTYRWVVSLRSGSRICLQLGHRTTNGLSDSNFDIDGLLFERLEIVPPICRIGAQKATRFRHGEGNSGCNARALLVSERFDGIDVRSFAGRKYSCGEPDCGEDA